jgi:hypothetical protein
MDVHLHLAVGARAARTLMIDAAAARGAYAAPMIAFEVPHLAAGRP